MLKKIHPDWWFLFVAALLLSAVAVLFSPKVGEAADWANSTVISTGVSGEALTSPVSAEVKLQRRYEKARLTLDYTYGAATSLTIAFECAVGRDKTYGGMSIRDCDASTAVCTVGPSATDVITGTADVDTNLEYDVTGCEWVKWTVTGGGTPTSSDLLTMLLSVTAS